MLNDKIEELTKSGISVGSCKGVKNRSGPHEGKRRRDRGTTPLRGRERTTVDQMCSSVFKL